MKKQNKKHQNAESIGKKLKTKGLMFFVSFFSCDLQDFKFWYVNRKAFGTSFLYWVDFTKIHAILSPTFIFSLIFEHLSLECRYKGLVK